MSRATEENLEFGGVVVSDTEWEEYATACLNRGVITTHFGGEQETRIWRDGSGGLLCRLGENGEVVPMYRYSDAMADPNTEAASESAVFLQRLIAGGMPMEAALALTNRIYSRVPHSQAISTEITQRIIEQWQRQNMEGQGP